MGKYSELVVARLNDQLEEVKKQYNHKMLAIAPSVVKTLIAFAENDDVATALLGEDKSIKDCLEYILKDVKDAASDLYCYQKAAEYYFDNATVSFKMMLSYDDTLSEVAHDGSQEPAIKLPKPEPAKKPDKKTGKNASSKSDAAQDIGSETPLQVLKPASTKGKAAKEEPNRKCIQLDLFASLTGGC